MSHRRPSNPRSLSPRHLLEPLEPRTLFTTTAFAAGQTTVPLANLQALQSDPTRPTVVYALTSSHVYAIDADLGRTVSWNTTQSAGSSLAVSPGGDRLYVGSSSVRSVQVFSLPDLTPITTLNLSLAPTSLAAGVHDQLYVAAEEGAFTTIAQVDAHTGAVVSSTANGSYTQITSSNDGTRLYTLGSSSGLTEYDLTGPAFQRLAGYNVLQENARDFAVDTDHHRAFTASGGIYGVAASDLASPASQTAWYFEQGGYGLAVALSPDQSVVYGAGWAPDAIEAFSTTDGTRLGRIATQLQLGRPLLAATTNGRVLYGGAVGFIEAATGSATMLGLAGGSSLAVEGFPAARAAFTKILYSGSAAVLFDASASLPYAPSDTLTSYAWDFGDGQTGTGPNPSHAYATSAPYTVRLSVTSSNGLTDQTVFTTNLPPTASLTTPPAPAAGSPAARFTVTFSDDDTIDPATLDKADILVAGPDAFSHAAHFVSYDASDPRHVTATYEIAAPNGTWNGTVNGTYTLVLPADQVTDTSAARVPAATLGTFTVDLPLPDAPDLVATVSRPLPRALKAGTRVKVPLRLTNTGTLDLRATNVSVQLFASTDPVLDDSDIALATTTTRLALRRKASRALAVPAAPPVVPQEGNYYLLARVDSTDAVHERDERNNVTPPSASVQFRNIHARLDLEFVTKPYTTFRRGEAVPALFRLSNYGPDTASGPVPFQVWVTRAGFPRDTGILVLDSSVTVQLRRGTRRVYPAFFPAPASLAGQNLTVYIVLDTAAAGDPITANKTTSSPYTLYVQP